MGAHRFWSLGWYDLNLWLERLMHKRKSSNDGRELSMELTRQFMCLFANANRGREQPALRPQDFMRLSYDSNVTETAKPDDNDLQERLDRLKKIFPDGK